MASAVSFSMEANTALETTLSHTSSKYFSSICKFRRSFRSSWRARQGLQGLDGLGGSSHLLVANLTPSYCSVLVDWSTFYAVLRFPLNCSANHELLPGSVSAGRALLTRCALRFDHTKAYVASKAPLTTDTGQNQEEACDSC